MLHLSNKLSASLDFRHTQATREELWCKDLFSMNKLKTATLKKKKWTNSIIASIEGTSSPLNPAQVFSRSSPCSSILMSFSSSSHDRLGLLGQQYVEAFLQYHPVPGKLVIWGESSWVGRAGGLPIWSHLLWKEKRVCLCFLRVSNHENRFSVCFQISPWQLAALQS